MNLRFDPHYREWVASHVDAPFCYELEANGWRKAVTYSGVIEYVTADLTLAELGGNRVIEGRVIRFELS